MPATRRVNFIIAADGFDFGSAIHSDTIAYKVHNQKLLISALKESKPVATMQIEFLHGAETIFGTTITAVRGKSQESIFGVMTGPDLPFAGIFFASLSSECPNAEKDAATIEEIKTLFHQIDRDKSHSAPHYQADFASWFEDIRTILKDELAVNITQ